MMVACQAESDALPLRATSPVHIPFASLFLQHAARHVCSKLAVLRYAYIGA